MALLVLFLAFIFLKCITESVSISLTSVNKLIQVNLDELPIQSNEVDYSGHRNRSQQVVSRVSVAERNIQEEDKVKTSSSSSAGKGLLDSLRSLWNQYPDAILIAALVVLIVIIVACCYFCLIQRKKQRRRHQSVEEEALVVEETESISISSKRSNRSKKSSSGKGDSSSSDSHKSDGQPPQTNSDDVNSKGLPTATKSESSKSQSNKSETPSKSNKATEPVISAATQELMPGSLPKPHIIEIVSSRPKASPTVLLNAPRLKSAVDRTISTNSQSDKNATKKSSTEVPPSVPAVPEPVKPPETEKSASGSGEMSKSDLE